jgi:hypothetical protein
MAANNHNFRKSEIEIFLPRRLDRLSRIENVAKLCVLAHVFWLIPATQLAEPYEETRAAALSRPGSRMRTPPRRQ